MVRVTGLVSVILSGVTGLSVAMAAAAEKPWKVGDERELTAGNYTRLVAQFDGWRVWRDTWESGAFCAAVKAANGVGTPIPRTATLFYGASPSVVISIGHNSRESAFHENGPETRPEWRFRGTWTDTSTEEYRIVGERFFTKKPNLFAKPAEWESFFALDGQTIEVHIQSWRYPAISVGGSEQFGKINLKGLSRALERVKACNIEGAVFEQEAVEEDAIEKTVINYYSTIKTKFESCLNNFAAGYKNDTWRKRILSAIRCWQPSHPDYDAVAACVRQDSKS